jgi:hypothetical protein
MSKSCRTCPSFVPSAEADSVYTKSPGGDTCIRFGRMLSRPNQTEDSNLRVCEAFATTCPAHDEPRPVGAAVPDVFAAQVSIGDPVAIQRAAQNPPSPTERPSSCFNCSNFVPPDVVRTELGWLMGACAAQGRLIFPTRYPAEAGDCVSGFEGPHRSTTSGMILMPQYEGVAQPIRVKAREYVLADEVARHSVDPRDYETDRTVTAAERSNHVRAWREVADPEGLHDSIMVPIFDGEALLRTYCPQTDHAGCDHDPRSSYGGHRPDLYVDHQGLLYDYAVELFELDETPLLIGPAGTGKTETGGWLAYLVDLPFNRYSVSKGSEVFHFEGEPGLVPNPENPGSTISVFNLARFAKNYSLPGVNIVDEPNLKTDIYEFLRPALDGAKQLIVNGMRLKRTPYTFLLAAQNPVGDPLYVGTEPMNAADLDRVSPFYYDLPTPDVERDIIRKHCADGGYNIDSLTLDKIMQVASDLRSQIKHDALPIAWGLRSQIKVARKTKYYSLEKAYRRAVVDGLDADLMDVVLMSVRSVA